MPMQEQERLTPPLETAMMASDEPQVGSAATMATSNMAGSGGAGMEERGPGGPSDNICKSSLWVAPMYVVGGVEACSCHTFDFSTVQRKPRSHVPRAAPSSRWGDKHGPIILKEKPEKWCLHCGTTWSLQWRMGPAGESTLCNACGVRYRHGRLVPEYRPRASPTFNESEHAYKHRDVLEIRKKQDHPAPPMAFKAINTRKHHKGKGQQQPAEIHKNRKSSNIRNKPAQAQQAAVLEMEQHLPPLPPELPPAAVNRDKMAQHLQPPSAQPHAGGELTKDDEPLPPPHPFLFNGPPAPMIIDDDEPVIVIIIDDD